MPNDTPNGVAGDESSLARNMGVNSPKINSHAQPTWAALLVASHAARKARWAEERA